MNNKVLHIFMVRISSNLVISTKKRNTRFLVFFFVKYIAQIK